MEPPTADLITTDILGPFNAPFAIANLGLVPGVLLYFFFGKYGGWYIRSEL